MSTELTLPQRVFALEKDCTSINDKMNFIKEAEFALQALKGNDALVKAATQNPESLEHAIINLASCGISLNPLLKEAYLVPRKGKVCLDISYMGLSKLAIDSGSIVWVQAEVVKEKDIFEFMGLGLAPVHKFSPFKDRGAVIGAYCVVKVHSGESLSTIMSKAEVDYIRSRSPSGQSADGPWANFYEEMVKKTVVKRASKLWPKSDKVLKAVSILNEHEGMDFSKGPSIDPDTEKNDPPVDETFSKIMKLLSEKGRTEEQLLEYLNKQFKNANLESIKQLNSSQVAYSIRILGGEK